MRNTLWEKVPRIEGELPSGEPKYRLVPGISSYAIRMPDELADPLKAIAAQLKKDRKRIHLRTFEKPLLPSVASITMKAIELMLWGPKSGKKAPKARK